MRLLPAAFLVICVSAVATWRYLPYDQWTENAKEFLASTLYYENWLLAARSINYSAQTQAETVVRHYWSLSVEEQFYLVWPLLLLAVTWAVRKHNGKIARRVLIASLSVVAIVFFTVSVVVTAHSPNQAYFVTPTRMWEFAVGGLVAVVAPRLSLPRITAELAALLGLAAILITCGLYGPTTPFPGSAAAIPVLGTALVILAGTHHQLLHERITGLRPVQFLGDISYSVYLWHWPLVVIVPSALNRDLDWKAKSAILVTSLVLAWLTKILIEDPGRRLRWPRAKSWRAFTLMGGGILVTGALSLSLIPLANAKITANDQSALRAAGSSCAGPRALHDPHCGNPFTRPVANPIMTDVNQYWTLPPECVSDPALILTTNASSNRCNYSSGRKEAPRVWLVGDSHAQEWVRTIVPAARREGWDLSIVLLKGCAPADAHFTGYGPNLNDPATVAECNTWISRVIKTIGQEHPNLILTAAYTRNETVSDGTNQSATAQMVGGLQKMWLRWTNDGAKVVAIADPPLNAQVRAPACVARQPKRPRRCAAPRALAQPPDPIVLAARSMPGIGLVDLTNNFCDATKCYAAIGGISIYFEASHLNGIYAELLEPYFLEQMARVAPAFVTRR